MLEKNGLQVIGFTNPQEAIEYFDDPSADCDLVVSDARMPQVTGFELARRIKSIRPDIKVILVSSFEISKEELEKVMPSTHIDGFLTKPFHITKLMEVVQSLD